MTENITVFTQSSIRIAGEKMMYADPFRVPIEPHDADVIFITHDHYDHFSPEDIAKVVKNDTTVVVPEKLAAEARSVVPTGGELITVRPNESLTVAGIPVETVAAYNNRKAFHPKSSGWVGYILTVGGERIYIAGDTDATADNRKVKCDIAMVPIGGTYTMDAKEAAEFVNAIRPKVAIPIHYGSIVGSVKDADVFRQGVDAGVEVVGKL